MLQKCLTTTYLPKRANIDGRKNELCAYVRRGIITKLDAKNILANPIECNQELLNETLLRLSANKKDLNGFINAPIKNWRQFNTYKSFFEKSKIIWYILYKVNIIPKSFFYKYCIRHKKRKI